MSVHAMSFMLTYLGSIRSTANILSESLNEATTMVVVGFIESSLCVRPLRSEHALDAEQMIES